MKTLFSLAVSIVQLLLCLMCADGFLCLQAGNSVVYFDGGGDGREMLMKESLQTLTRLYRIFVRRVSQVLIRQLSLPEGDFWAEW